jgi:hypothetical protein
MANLSNFAQVIYLERFPKLDTATHAAPTNFYACLCSSLPTVSQTGATMPEVGNVGGYARTVIAFANAPTGATPTSIANSAVVTFPASTAAYSAAATHFAVCDSATFAAGNMYYFGALKGTNAVNTLATNATAATGTFVIAVDGTNTAAIPVGTTGAGLLEYIEALGLASVPVGSVTVTPTATAFTATSTTFTITFLDNNIVGQTHTLTMVTQPTTGVFTAAQVTAGAPGTITVSGANQTPSIPISNLTVQMS